jgi:signal transduction histidine kinase
MKSAPTPDDHGLVLSNLSPSPAQKRFAIGVILVLLVCCVGLAGPFSTQQLGRIDAFMPAYSTAIFVSDSITATLLFAQFSVLRSPALLALASGYLWSGFMAVAWVLTFPGVFPQGGPLGAGLQSTPWLYLFWHEGFILFVIAYVLLKDFDPYKSLSTAALRRAILASVGSVTAIALGAIVLVTAGQALMPPIMIDTVRVNVRFYLLGPLFALSAIAFVLLWLRLRSVLELWLMVVLCAFVIEVTLSIYPSSARFTAGWYGSRVYTLLYSNMLLLMLLIETTKLYGRLLQAVFAQHREREVREAAMEATVGMIAHELKQPLTVIVMQARAGLRWIAKSDLVETRDSLEALAGNALRASEVIDGIRSLFKKNIHGRARLDVNQLIQQVLIIVNVDLRSHQVSVSTELSERLPQVLANRAQLEQVFINLIMNAIEAMESVADRSRLLRIASDIIGESPTVLVTIEDTGQGLDRANEARIFEPFFTTKSKGMGIGLLVCRTIVETHGGSIAASRNDPYGTTFRITLPGTS